MQTNVLVVDDEKPIRDMVCFALRQQDYNCIQAADTEAAYDQICRKYPDIILLDWMLPSMSGVDFVGILRARNIYQNIPIIMLTAKTEESDILKGFYAGCDDYITKPFSTRELIVRIKAILRRSQDRNPSSAIIIGKLLLDPSSQRVMIDSIELHPSPTEYRLLKFFMTHSERVYTRIQLLDYVWGETTYIEERTVDVHIRRLRKLLAPYKMDYLIQTVRGAGYRLSEKPDKALA